MVVGHSRGEGVRYGLLVGMLKDETRREKLDSEIPPLSTPSLLLSLLSSDRG